MKIEKKTLASTILLLQLVSTQCFVFQNERIRVQLKGKQRCQLVTENCDQHNSKHTILASLPSENEEEESQINDAESDELVTKEMFMREMLSDPKVKRKRKGGKEGGYRVLDNRDALPFVVKVATPDPYTSPETMKKEARRISKLEAKRNEKKMKKQNGVTSGSRKIRKNLVGMDGKDGIAASVRLRQSDGTLHKILGEFQLDKNTNCGDLIEVGEREFEVQKARCQYKYAGGKRFIMVRKILEVKEVTRIAEENYLKRQFGKDALNADDPPQLE